jgi:hypothetical protein
LAALVAAATSAEGLARGQSFGQAETVVIGRPSPQVGFRSHTGPAWSGTFYVLENRTKVAHGGKAMVRSHFLVEGTVAAEFVTRRDSAIKAKRLTPWIDSMGNLGLWAQSVSGQGENAWIDSGRAAIVAARHEAVESHRLLPPIPCAPTVRPVREGPLLKIKRLK